MSGLFISIEGMDGAGKTTIQTFLFNWFNELIHNNIINFNSVKLTREPGGKNVEVCENLRNILLNNKLDLKTEILIFAASRSEHWEKFIKPNLKLNNVVISDRYLDSSLVYQGIANNNFELNFIYSLNLWAIESKLPDITIYLKIDPELARQRALSRLEQNKFDQKDLIHYQKISDGFDSISNTNRFIIIDANDTNTIYEQLKNKILIKLSELNLINKKH